MKSFFAAVCLLAFSIAFAFFDGAADSHVGRVAVRRLARWISSDREHDHRPCRTEIAPLAQQSPPRNAGELQHDAGW